MNIPSVKSLRMVFGEKAGEARRLISGQSSPMQYESVQVWIKACVHTPDTQALVMEALDELADTYGVEYVAEGKGPKSPSFEYLNTGDSHAPTLIRFEASGRYAVSSFGSVIEKGNYP